MGFSSNVVDPNLRRIVFGAQKQGDSVLEAIVLFLQEHFLDNGYNGFPIPKEDGTIPSSEEMFLEDITSHINSLCNKVGEGVELTEDERLFLNLLLGLQEIQKVGVGVKAKSECISDTGKHVFYLLQEVIGQTGVQYSGPEGNTKDVIEYARKTASKEDEAQQLIKEILADCPNRADYPEDDALAAIMYGEVYWNANR